MDAATVHTATVHTATVHTASETTGWSVRMLHYLDAAGLVRPPRSTAGYRLYGAGQIARLRELRRLLAEHDLKPADLQVALRLRTEPELRRAVDGWLDASLPTELAGSAPIPPALIAPAARTPVPNVDALSWLRFEQDKHSRGFRTAQHPDPSTDHPTEESA